MNEILKSKKLTEEILARAAAIKGHMEDCNARMANMERIEQEAKSRLCLGASVGGQVVTHSQNVPQTRKLLDLPDDVLGLVVKAIKSYDGLVTLSRVGQNISEHLN